MPDQKPAVVLLAGGASSRFHPLNTTTHKSFMQICGKPLIVHALTDLKQHEFSQVVVVLSPRDYAEHSARSLAEEYNLGGLDVQFVLQPEPRGQGDAIFKASQHLDHPDSLLIASPYHTDLGTVLSELWQRHQQSGAAALLLGAPTDQPQEYGILHVESDRVLGIEEKPDPTSLPDAAPAIRALSCYSLNKSVIERLENTEGQYSLESCLDTVAKEDLVKWMKSPAPLVSLKYAWQLLSVAEKVLATMESSTASSAQVASTAIIDDSAGPVVIDEYAQIKDFAKISGPAYIGTGVLVGEHCFVRSSSIEHNTIVGSYSEIVRSVLLPGVSMHQSYCSDSILGNNTQIGAGLITANLRLDHQPICATVERASEHKKVNTQRRKLGLITGDGVHIGVRVTTMPGIIIGAGATVFPGSTVFQSIGTNQVVKNSPSKGCSCQT